MKSKKEQILDISLSLFLEKGYDNTSISDIVTKLDIARGTLYYHFESKEAIMDAIIERSVKEIVEKVKRWFLRRTYQYTKRFFPCFLLLV